MPDYLFQHFYSTLAIIAFLLAALENGLSAAIVNPPGYSEHNCGLAADLNSPEHTGLDAGFEKTAAFRWLKAHAVEYGFILRYPNGSSDITGIIYEPWHYRYVGKDAAQEIFNRDITLEEYLGKTEH